MINWSVNWLLPGIKKIIVAVLLGCISVLDLNWLDVWRRLDLNSTNALMSSTGSFFCNDLTINQGCMFYWKINTLPFLNIFHLFLGVITVGEINDFQGVNIEFCLKTWWTTFHLFLKISNNYHFYSKNTYPCQH